MAETEQKRGLIVSSGWVQAALLVILFGFSILGWLAYEASTEAPPLPARVVDPSGAEIFSGDDITRGQVIFLHNGLMEYGSIFGHGGYLGPDYTADYLRRSALAVRDQYGGATSDQARAKTIDDFRTNRYDPASGTLRFSAAQAQAFASARVYYQSIFAEPSTRYGLRPSAISDPVEIKQLTAFFGWSAWAAAANRPGEAYSYTNNWPPEPLVDNHPTADNVVWSLLSLIALLAGIGLLFAAFGRWNFLGWHGREQQQLSFFAPGEVVLTPAQRATAYFFFVMAGLFLVQALVGGATQHYRSDLTGFFGLDLARLFPYNLMRTWHVQLSILWVSTSYLAAGIFLAPMIAGREPRRQNWLAYALLAALTIVVVGSLLGEMAGIHGWRGALADWFGNQGFEYLDLGRFWQILLTIGLFFWVAILFRGLRGRLQREHLGNMPWLFFFAALAIPAFYAVGLLARPESNFTTADFWRFWVVHLWVEDFLELFTTIMVAYVFVLLGVVAERVALRVIYLDIVLYSAGGVVGTMHHLYFSGTPAQHMALGAFFSAGEVIPLTFLTIEAWSFLQLGSVQEARSRTPFPHRWAVMFLASVGFWNFVGAGIFGFLVNLPIVSYYEIGTALTANHAHAAMMGVYGMLAAALALFCLRYLVPAERWSDRAARLSFWSLNLGLTWMCFATLFPLGILQLYESVSQGYFEARTLQYLTGSTNALLEWLRLPGDIVFIAGGVLPLLYLCWLGVRYRVGRTTLEEPEHPLFTEIGEIARPGCLMLPTLTLAEVHPETLLAAGYATLLLLVALGLERMAARSHRRAENTATAGFRYDQFLDHWECPTGKLLHPAEVDRVRRLVRYRARATACNRCPVKARCTDSDRGREVIRSLDPWPRSEIARFHRGISLLLLGLAGLVASVGLLRHHADDDLVVLGLSIATTVVTIQRLLPGFIAERSKRNGEPDGDWHDSAG